MLQLHRNILNEHNKGNSARKISENLKISQSTVRKVLITYGVLETSLTKRIRELRVSGMPNDAIADLLKISKSCVAANSPYEKGTYLVQSNTVNAIRVRECRAKKGKEQG